MEEGRYQIEVLYRGPWKFLGIYDRMTRYFYTLMREKNLLSLRKNQSTKLFHYMNALSRLDEGLKDEYVVENEQLCLFPDMMYDEEGEETLDRILEKIIAKIDGSIERYVLISFDISHGQVLLRLTSTDSGLYSAPLPWLMHLHLKSPFESLHLLQ